MNAVVTDDDWRLMGQEKWLTGRELRWASWTPESPDNDHDHCEFCQGEFAAAKTEHVDFTAGYVTTDDHDHWICEQCFANFQGRFGWTVIDVADG